jgi:PRC-barrel domain
MESTTYASRLRYLDADDVEDAVVDYDGLDVYGADGQKLGDVDGFIIDPDARRVNYIVIDSGGWFTSRRLLLPIGHATLAPDRKSLQTDTTREALRRLPSFDEQQFNRLQDEELRAFERATVLACCPDEPLEDVSARTWSYDSRKHYRQPDWWSSSRYAPERLRAIDRSTVDSSPSTAGMTADRNMPPALDTRNRDLVTAREGRDARAADDQSPHLDGRAQPGDVLGIETAGEVTGLGDTSEDEDKRRRDAERAAADDRDRD